MSTPQPGPDDTSPAAGPPSGTPVQGDRFARTRLPLAVGLIACVVGSAGSRLLNPLPVSQISPLTLALIYLILLGAAAWLIHTRRGGASPHPSAPAPTAAPQTPTPPPASSPPSQAVPADVADTTSEDLLNRVRTVLTEHFPDVIIHAGSVRFDDEGQVCAFSLKTRVASGFTDSKLREKVYDRIAGAVPYGKWNMDPDTRRDMLHWKVKSGYPSAIAPPLPSRIVTSADDALTLYKNFSLKLGVDEAGQLLAIDLQAFPHLLLIGGTGSGKSVFVRTLIEDLRKDGWMLFLGDGKTTDYTGLIGQPNIVAVSQTTADHVRLVRTVAADLKARQADARRIQFAGGGGDPFRRPPIMLILDEYATMIAHIKGTYGKDAEQFIADLKFLTRVGREFKVHMILATQEAYRDTVDGQLLGNMKARISLGPPEDKTIKEVFPEQLKAEAARKGASIDKKRDAGRGLALLAGDDGTNQVVEFQSFYGYSPNAPKAPPPTIAADHEQYRIQIADQIPKLYPRLWWAVDNADYGLDIEHLYSLPTILLDGRDGNPDPENLQYDPLADCYNGHSEAGGPPIPALSELQDGVRFTSAPPPTPSRSYDDEVNETAPARTTPPTPDEDPWEGVGDPAESFDSPGPAPDLTADSDAADGIDTEPITVDSDYDDPPFDVDPTPPPPPRRTRPNTGAVNI